MIERLELPGLATARAARHQAVAPVQAAVRRRLQVDALDKARAGKRNDRIPMARQFSAFLDLNVEAHGGGSVGIGRVNLQR